MKVKKMIGYVRISSESQIDNTSVKEQTGRIKAYCTSQGWLLERLFIDEGKSASTTEREGYKEMIKLVEAGENQIGGIIVLKADRIHRSLKNMLNFIYDELAPRGMSFISVSENFDTSTAQGLLFLQLISGFSEFERSIINERTKSGRISTANDNKHAGGAIPYGYKMVGGKIIIDEGQSSVIKQIYSAYIERGTIYKIAKSLNQQGIPTKTGKAWTVVQIKNILTNESYTGISTYNGKKEQNNIRQKDVFPRIISRQLFNRALELLKSKIVDVCQ